VLSEAVSLKGLAQGCLVELLTGEAVASKHSLGGDATDCTTNRNPRSRSIKGTGWRMSGFGAGYSQASIARRPFLSSLQGTGDNGRVIVSHVDMVRHVAVPDSPQSIPAPNRQSTARTPERGVLAGSIRNIDSRLAAGTEVSTR
jgi:hypothetical protein